MEKKQERYLQVPYAILNRKDISERAKLIYALIQGFSKGECRVTDAYLSDLFNASPRAIQRDIKQLKDADLAWTRFRTIDKKIIGRTLYVKGVSVKKTQKWGDEPTKKTEEWGD